MMRWAFEAAPARSARQPQPRPHGRRAHTHTHTYGAHHPQPCARLKRQSGVIASFSRALTEGLSRDMDDATFTKALDASCAALYDASFQKITEDDGAAPAMYRDVSSYLGKD